MMMKIDIVLLEQTLFLIGSVNKTMRNNQFKKFTLYRLVGMCTFCVCYVIPYLIGKCTSM